jgi:uncharacterized protein (TIGR04255 family)
MEMPFPETPRVIYDKNPLAEVICQFRFPTILRISSQDVAPFQEKIREDYPLYKLEEPVFEMPGVPRELLGFMEQMMLKPPGFRTHRFLTKDSKRFIALSHEFLALSESDYKQWEAFKGEIEKAEKALREVYKPAFYSRVGLRYKDVISPKSLGLSNKKWSDLLSQYIAGELADEKVAKAINQMKTRCVIGLPEIPGGNVILNHGLVENASGEMHYLIDADFGKEHVEGADEAFRILDNFHRLAGQLFRWAITETLHNAMQPRTI